MQKYNSKLAEVNKRFDLLNQNKKEKDNNLAYCNIEAFKKNVDYMLKTYNVNNN